MNGIGDPRRWMLEEAAPRWTEHGIDREHGGFFETIDTQTFVPAGEIKRLRTVCRQIYAFCEMGALGLPDAARTVEHGLAFLLGHHSRDDGAFHERVTRHGEPLDGCLVLYDLAFALFAMAHAYRLTSASVLQARSRALVAFLEREMKHPQWGFLEQLPAAGPRAQNPHMHLLEAALAWLDHDPDGSYRELAQSLIKIFETQLFHSDSGILSEFPQDADGATARIHRFEPGHHFEWIWLLDRALAHGLSVPDLAPRLAATALREGVSAAGVPYGAIVYPGGVEESQCRIWQVTEWARVHALGLLGETRDARALTLLARFMDHPVPGFWYERCECSDGNMINEPVKATSLYHVVGAMNALIANHATPENAMASSDSRIFARVPSAKTKVCNL